MPTSREAVEGTWGSEQTMEPAQHAPTPKGTEAEDIKKRWQEYTEELYKNDLHDPDNHAYSLEGKL